MPVEGESGIELPAPSEEEPVAEEEPEEVPAPESTVSQGPKLVTEPPSMGGVLTANSQQESLDPTTDPFSMPQSEAPQLLDHQQLPSEAPQAEDTPPQPEPEVPEPQPEPETPEPTPAPPEPAPPVEETPQLTPPPTSWTPPEPPADEPASPPEPPISDDQEGNQTLAEIESAVESPHAEEADQDHLDTARDEVSKALSSADAAGLTPPQPSPSLNALPIDLNPADLPSEPTTPGQVPQQADPNAPPPVPPPIPFQFGAPSNTQQNQQ